MRSARAIGALDIGQAVVVQQGLVLGVEAIEGTDALIRRCRRLRRDGPGGVLVKAEKPGQERRADRPTIGPQTVSLAAESGLRGVAAQAGATIVLERAEPCAAPTKPACLSSACSHIDARSSDQVLPLPAGRLRSGDPGARGRHCEDNWTIRGRRSIRRNNPFRRPERHPSAATGSSAFCQAGPSPMRGWHGSTGRSAPGCCCSRAGGGSRWPREPGWPDPVLLLLFAIGAVAMRGAGCTLNDIADRDYDARVARTRLRPLPSGRITVPQAGAFLLAQLAVGAAVLFSLNRLSILLGLAVLGLIGTYPFMKRITYWPQVFLGLNFNWGALLGWTAVTGSLGWPAVLLYLGGVFWTLGYDTIYAHQDKEDDVTDRRQILGAGPRKPHPAVPVRVLCRCSAALGIGGRGRRAGIGFWPALAAAALQLAWQAARVDTDDAADCLAKFRSNRAVGWLLLAGIVAGHFS